MQSVIMFVDDEPNVLHALTRAVLDEPYEVITAPGGVAGLKLLETTPCKVVVSDEMMPEMDGSEFLALVRERHHHVVRIMLTGHASVESAMKAVNQGEIYRFFTKPWNDIELKLAIRSAIEKYDLEAENRRLLATVKSQSLELKLLERQHPGISRIEKDDCGAILLPDLPEDELSSILEECEKEFSVISGKR